MPNIPEIKARYEAASPGPWTPTIVLYLAAKADVEFAAEARTDIPQLVTALEEAQKLLSICESYDENHNWYVEGEKNGQHTEDCLGCRIKAFLGESK